MRNFSKIIAIFIAIQLTFFHSFTLFISLFFCCNSLQFIIDITRVWMKIIIKSLPSLQFKFSLFFCVYTIAILLSKVEQCNHLSSHAAAFCRYANSADGILEIEKIRIFSLFCCWKNWLCFTFWMILWRV